MFPVFLPQLCTALADATNIEAGRVAFRFIGMPAPTVLSRLSWALPRRTRDTSSHAARFDVGPRYFPGVVRVQPIKSAVCSMQCALTTHPRADFHLPVAGLYFANIEAGRA